ncbi:MAG: PIN domain-containing protein [Pseudonocardiaceae bacterium]|nr:PIN domain-containing protein [Pseudonocardiaceae bacterium]
MDLTSANHVVLDTSACIYYLDCPPTDPRCAVLLPVMRSAEQGEFDLLVSTVTVTELLAGPLRGGDRDAEASVRLFLDLLCRVVPVDRAVAERAAALRADHGLRTPDALICATALLVGPAVVVGNDERWKRIGGEVDYRHLDDLVHASEATPDTGPAAEQ